MSDDNLNIAPSQVKNTGVRLGELASSARTATDAYFDSQQPAATGNPGFAAGPKLVAYARALHNEINEFITELVDNSHKIITSATAIQTLDNDNADGFNRELAALNGLSQKVMPGR